MSNKVSILVPPPILEGTELVYLRRPGELCCGDVVNQKVFLNITVTRPYRSQSKKSAIPVESPMILVRYTVNQVSVMVFLNPCISKVVVDEVFIKSFIYNTGCD